MKAATLLHARAVAAFQRGLASISPVLLLVWRVIQWMDAAWAKHDLTRKNPMHPDLPGLVIRERELRP